MERVAQLQTELSAKGAAAAILTSMENIHYLTGHYVWTAHSPTTFAVVPAAGSPLLYVPEGDASLARTLSRIPVEPYDPGATGWRTAAGLAKSTLEKVSAGTLGIEYGATTVGQYEVLKDVLCRWAFTDVSPALARLRLFKDTEEQERLRGAARLVYEGFTEIGRALQPGITELELKGRADLAAYSAARRRFPRSMAISITNVLSGAKLNRLHDAAGSEAVEAGKPVFALAHTSLNGYWANMGRTFFVPGGTPDAEIQRACELVARAQRTAIGLLSPGHTLGEALRASEQVLASGGFANRRIYGMFRGLGLRYDELPRPSDLEMKVEPGMCICVQLHVRLPDLIVGQGDSVLVTNATPEILSDAH